ncbi:aldo/keto reductase [Clostridium polynesiense]|uniref:aldo/keto reductase n=1 Tax=Clostridium polynesiense TaxID=1325933 RepID=UPI00058DDD35|nr:aldo/keto reductase [Clostridium polynesiense]
MDESKAYAILNNGVKMPWIGYGVFKTKEGEEVISSVKTALETGYRSIDTAKAYGNEEGVGAAIRESSVPREDIFLATKVWNSDQGYESTLKAFEDSLKRLDTDYVDLYLVHWPVEGKFIETYKALEDIYKEGMVKAIGVCNFNIHHLEELLKECTIPPMINQVELHPLHSQPQLREFCRANDIQIESWGPLMQGGKILDNELVGRIASEYGKTPAQVILRWHYENNLIAIPKSITPSRIKENFDIFNFHLSEEHKKIIDDMNMNLRVGPDPDNFNF